MSQFAFALGKLFRFYLYMKEYCGYFYLLSMCGIWWWDKTREPVE